MNDENEVDHTIGNLVIIMLVNIALITIYLSFNLLPTIDLNPVADWLTNVFAPLHDYLKTLEAKL